MTADLRELHDELRSSARGLLGRAAPAGVDRHRLVESGWVGLEVAESEGGVGATFAEVGVVLEEMGRAAASSPFLGTAVLGVGALSRLEPSPDRDELLRRVVRGDDLVAVALPAGEDAVVVGGLPFRLEPGSGSLRLHGASAFVPDAPDADRLLFLARDPSSCPVVVVADARHPDIRVEPQSVLDATRRFGLVTADGAEIQPASALRFRGDAEASVRRLVDRGAVAVACDSLGLSDAMLQATVDYVGVRRQFGRPVGSFQAVKHACADMLVQISLCRALVSAAVQQLAADDPDASIAAAMAKSYAGEVAVDVAGKAMQLHGGIGYTWESGVHVYLKRALLNRSLFGSPRAHRLRLARRFDTAPPVDR